MTIKSRLLTAFAVLVALVVLMGTALVVFGVQNNRLSANRLFHYSRLFFWREIYQAFDLHWRDLNYYVILGDPAEKDKSREQFRLITDRVEQVQGWPALTAWLDEYRQFNRISEENITGSRERFFRIFSGELSRRSMTLRGELEGFIDEHTRAISDLESRIRRINTFGIVFSVVIGILSIIMGGLMSLFIFNSIARPLGVLQEGVKVIGGGDLDHRIKVDSADEIGKLAESFNQMVQNLRTLQLQIMQMDRMSSIGRLAGGVAHEINNPLTGVLGQAQLLLEKIPANDPSRGNVERIESAAQRCRTIVRALLDFARDKNYNFEQKTVEQLVNETLEFTKIEMDSRKISVVKKIPPQLPKVRVSAGHIQQVFLNIVTNGIQAMGKNGGGTLTVGAKTDGQFVEVSFSDTGSGIKQEHLSHVFDPFFTTKEIGQGTGLGLTISYGIIQKHNGEIIAQSGGEGKGATFVVRLPKAS